MSRFLTATFTCRRSDAAARIIVVLMLAVLLAGCGKKGNPSPPADAPNTYPRQYPSS